MKKLALSLISLFAALPAFAAPMQVKSIWIQTAPGNLFTSRTFSAPDSLQYAFGMSGTGGLTMLLRDANGAILYNGAMTFIHVKLNLPATASSPTKEQLESCLQMMVTSKPNSVLFSVSFANPVTMDPSTGKTEVSVYLANNPLATMSCQR